MDSGTSNVRSSKPDIASRRCMRFPFDEMIKIFRAPSFVAFIDMIDESVEHKVFSDNEFV